MSLIRPLAIFLPQFHQIPENDNWWGPGFTEWTNVKKARPLVKEHYQPHLPSGLGYYDISDPDVRKMQASMARSYGIYGFCYYHYWFHGKRILNLPIDEILRTGEPEFPFCLAWANEDWTRAWASSASEILIKQEYSHEDDLNHIRFLCEIFADPRYIRVQGKPLFIIYKPFFFPDIKRTISIWRAEAVSLGIGDIYLGYFENEIQFQDPQDYGFDCAIEFQPNWWLLPPSKKRFDLIRNQDFNDDLSGDSLKHRFYDYPEMARIMIEAGREVAYKRFRCVTPMWDNTPRRIQGATVFLNATPDNFEFWLKSVVDDFKPFSREENFVFLNAWNEWGEGNHLEPCQKWDYAYLEKTKKVLDELTQHNGL